jgi:recombination protein RecT
MTEQTTPPPTGTEVALPSESAPPTLGQRITSMEHQFAMAAPRGFEARQLVRDAMTALAQTPKLMECEPRSVLGGLMTMAQLGLRVGVLGHGWVLPFWDSRYEWTDPATGRKQRGAFRAQLIVGYKGYVALAHRSGQIASISARTVHANDHFEVEYGVDEKLVHRPSKTDRGDAVGYYAVVRFANGGHSFWHLSREEAEHHRDRYAMAKKRDGSIVGPWRDNFDEMAQKTCVRALAKFMPQNTDLATALAVDDTVRVDLTPDSDPVHVSEHIESTVTEDRTPTATDDIPVEEPPAGGDA